MTNLVPVSEETNRWWSMTIKQLRAERDYLHSLLENSADHCESVRAHLLAATLQILIIMRKKGFREEGLHF